jgi:hypothetical protein
MPLKTRMNGGESSLQQVADAWRKEEHAVVWSQYESDAWAVEFAKKINEAMRRAGPVKPDPRNIHPG